MEPEVCAGCGADCVALDTSAGVVVCESCGLVREETQFRCPEFDSNGEPQGIYVGGRGTGSATLGCSGRWAVSHGLGFRTDRKRKYGTSKLDDLTSLLRLPKDKVDDVRHLVKVVTEDKWGTGRWMDVLVGTCIYIVARQNHLPLSAAEIGGAVNCGVKELLRMYFRVLDVADIKTPNIDPVVYFDRIMSTLPAFTNLQKDSVRKLSKQGHLLLHCGSKWFLATGRHPLPLVAAVVVIVATANQIQVELEEVSRDLHVHPTTSRLRLKEFQESLVGVGQSLPWGKDITLKTVNRHLPFLLRYLEAKMRKDCGSKPEKDALLRVTLPTQAENEPLSSSSRVNAPVKHLERAIFAKYSSLLKGSLNFQGYVVVEDKALATSGTTELMGCVERKSVDGHACGQNEFPFTEGADDPREAISSAEDCCFQKPTVDWDGKEDPLGLDGKEISMLENKHFGWEPLPPSFVANKVARARRLLKMEAAKKRIALVIQDMTKKLNGETISSLSEFNQQPSVQWNESHLPAQSTILPTQWQLGLKGLDAEDLLIEYFLLRGANEELIEDGQYNLLLTSSPVQPEEEKVLDKDLLKYLRSPLEVEFLKSLYQEDPIYPWLRSTDE